MSWIDQYYACDKRFLWLCESTEEICWNEVH